MSEPTLRPVHSEDDEGDLGVEELSFIGQLKDRRQEILKKQFIDLPVPRWEEPVIVVRYKPVDHKVFRSANSIVERATPDKRPESEVNVNCDILARACMGVFAVVNGQRYSLRPGDPTGEWTKFDSDLAENLGCEKTARSVIKALYIVEGDILSTATKISEFSGYKEQEADDTLMGE